MTTYESTGTTQEIAESSERALRILDYMSDVFFVLDPKWHFTYLNATAELMLGRQAGELVGASIWKEFPELTNTKFYTACREAMRSGKTKSAEIDYARTDSVLLANMYPVNGELAVHMSDSTERLAEQETVRQSEALYRFITENSADLITLCDTEGAYIYVSSVAKELLGYHPYDLVGSSMYDLFHPEDRDIAKQIMSGSPSSEHTPIVSYRMRRKDGNYVWVETTARIYSFEKSGSAKEVILVSRDITERKEAEDAMFRIAFHDALTGLPNRKLLHDRLEVSLKHAKRTGSLVAVLFLDLDRFKMINDTMGHHAGDELLKETAGRLRVCLRDEDTVARFGGDEFVVLLSDITNQEDAIRVAETLLQTAQTPYRLNKKDIHVNLSVGIAIFPSDGQDANTLLKNADNALYEAKESGRNSFKIYSPAMHIKAAAKMFLEDGLRRTVARNELRVYYQPLWDTRKDEMFGAEALLRWQHPTKGLILPSEFIPLAEEAGIITSIGEWILTNLVEQVQAWQANGLEIPSLSVNISPRQFHNHRFIEFLIGVFKEAEIPPEKLMLELTERVAMQNVEESIPRLTVLKEHGFRIAIDDFGSGYSSLGYLRQLPLDVLKIDRSFATESTASEREKTIVQAIVTLGHTLDLQVCAEGVETKEQFDFFHAIGADLVQGFYVARPQQPGAFQRLLTGDTRLALST